MDRLVTMQPFHLKKLPLSIHSSTYNVCHPIDEHFRPDNHAVSVDKMTDAMFKRWTKVIDRIAGSRNADLMLETKSL